MRTTNKDKATKNFSVALQNVMPIPPSNIVLTLTLLEKEKGGEMYGM